MNRYSIRTLLLSVAVAVSSFASAKYTFAPSSRLSSGRWVKMSVKETGIYEISYDELRQLGFSDPTKVGVYGKGGAMLPMSFADRRGTPQFDDDIQPVAVHHGAHSLFFYGRGVENISFDPASESFARGELNIYSDTGAYFLSDVADEPMRMTVNPEVSDTPVRFSYGYDYLYHERDIFQNSTSTGQLFWGESFLSSGPSFEWNYSLPYADTGVSALMECVIYADRNSSGRLGFGVRGATGNADFKIVPATSSTFRPQGFSKTGVTIPSADVRVFAEGTEVGGDFVNLDYWLLSYRKNVPDFSVAGASQERLFLDTRNAASGGSLAFRSGADLMVFDVSDPSAPVVLTLENDGKESVAKFPASGTSASFVICDLSGQQLAVSGFEVLNNTDLHALAAEGADLLVITSQKYKPYADRLAALHEQYDGIRTAVVLLDDVYNEFSGGVPDPMAYRAIVKMLYESAACPLKNVLFIGTVYGNFRSDEALSAQGIIGFQEPVVAADRDAANAMDFYGMTADYISTTSIQDEQMQVGVGVIPCYSETDAALYVDKVERYLRNDDFAYLANEFVSVGGVGNAHTHDTQSTLISDYLNAYLPSQGVTSNVVIDAYGYKGARKKFLDDLDRGKIFTFYHGHGAAYQICDKAFFNNSCIGKLTNPDLGFMYVGGCDFSGTDFQRPGLGELFVTGTRHGMIGMISSTRTTWSGQNFDFSRRLINSLFHAPGDSNRLRSSTPTIGEVFAEAKTSSPYANELCYLLVGDPALRVNIPLRSISVESSVSVVAPENTFIISGSVLDADGNIDGSYNGEVVLKFMRPEKTVRCADYETAGKNDDKTLDVKYPDSRIIQLSGKITDGRFSVKCILPGKVADFGDESVAVFASAYSRDAKVPASGYLSVPLTGTVAGSSSTDSHKPSVSIDFNSCERLLYITANDNMLLASDCLSASVDGSKVSVRYSGSNPAISAPTMVFFIPCDRLSDGTHSLDVKCKDVAGNETAGTFSFEVKAPTAPLRLEASAKTTIDDIVFYSDAESSDLNIVITDSNGSPVAILPFPGQSVIWDCISSHGNRVAPGLYRAKLTGTTTANAHLYSDWTHFAVLE